MLCPICKVEMRLFNPRHEIKYDDTPDKETELYYKQDLKCRNKNCSNYDKVIETISTPIKLSEAT